MLEAICDDLWHVTQPMRMPGGVVLPIRMTVVKTSSGDLLLHSPVALSDPWADAVEDLGSVRWIVAPNLYHHVYAKPALERFSNARLLAAPGLDQKRPDLSGGLELSERLPDELAGDFEMILVGGAPKVNELVLFHRSSASVILSDLVFNVHKAPNFMAGILLTLFGTRGRFAKSRMWRMLVKDAEAHTDSLERICAWPTQRVIVGHGEIVEQDASTQLSAALS
jgi:hypothetical protein